MAEANRFTDLRREINSLIEENDELRQMVQLLRENQELRDNLPPLDRAAPPVLTSTQIEVERAPRSPSFWQRRDLPSFLDQLPRQRPPAFFPSFSSLVAGPGPESPIEIPSKILNLSALPEAGAAAAFRPDPNVSIPNFAERASYLRSTPIQAHLEGLSYPGAEGSAESSQLGSMAAPLPPEYFGMLPQAAPGPGPAPAFSPGSLGSPVVFANAASGSAESSQLGSMVCPLPQKYFGGLPPAAPGPAFSPGSLGSPVVFANAAAAGPPAPPPRAAARPMFSLVPQQTSAWSMPTTIRLSQADSVFSPAHAAAAPRRRMFPLAPQDASAWSLPSPVHLSQADSVFSPVGSIDPIYFGLAESGPISAGGLADFSAYSLYSPAADFPAQAPAPPPLRQRPAPFVLQPPPPGRKGRKPPSPAPAPMPLAPAPELQSPQERKETSVKTGSDAKSTDARERLVGEIAFQLDRRILSNIFPDRIRLYGFTVCNIPKKVEQSRNDPYSQLNEQQASAIMERYNAIMNRLKPLGYNPDTHPRRTEQVVNTFGILRERPEPTGAEAASYNDVQNLRNVVRELVPPEMNDDCMLLLNCLHQLSQDDGKPLFIW